MILWILTLVQNVPWDSKNVYLQCFMEFYFLKRSCLCLVLKWLIWHTRAHTASLFLQCCLAFMKMCNLMRIVFSGISKMTYMSLCLILSWNGQVTLFLSKKMKILLKKLRAEGFKFMFTYLWKKQSLTYYWSGARARRAACHLRAEALDSLVLMMVYLNPYQ